MATKTTSVLYFCYILLHDFWFLYDHTETRNRAIICNKNIKQMWFWWLFFVLLTCLKFRNIQIQNTFIAGQTMYKYHNTLKIQHVVMSIRIEYLLVLYALKILRIIKLSK